MGQTTLAIADYDEFLVPTATTITLHFGLHPDQSDTATDRYINIEDTDRGVLGFMLNADEGIAISKMNNRTFKVPRPLAKNVPHTIRRGDWKNITFVTTVANTTIRVDIVA